MKFTLTEEQFGAIKGYLLLTGIGEASNLAQLLTAQAEDQPEEAGAGYKVALIEGGSVSIAEAHDVVTENGVLYLEDGTDKVIAAFASGRWDHVRPIEPQGSLSTTRGDKEEGDDDTA